MIKITTSEELHAVLARLDQEGAVWGVGQPPQFLEESLATHLYDGDIIIEWRWSVDHKTMKCYKELYWQHPMSAEEYLQEENTTKH